MRGSPPGTLSEKSCVFDGDRDPEPGDVVETKSGLQWRIVDLEFKRKRWWVLEQKLPESEYTDPDWWERPER